MLTTRLSAAGEAWWTGERANMPFHMDSTLLRKILWESDIYDHNKKWYASERAPGTDEAPCTGCGAAESDGLL